MKKIDIKSLCTKKFREICFFTYVFMECKEVAKCLYNEEKKATKAGKAKEYSELHYVTILKMINNFYGDYASPLRISYTRKTEADKLAIKLLYMLEADGKWQEFFIKEINNVKF